MKITYLVVFLFICKRGVMGKIDNDDVTNEEDNDQNVNYVNPHHQLSNTNEYEDDYYDYSEDDDCDIFKEEPKVLKCCPKNQLVRQVNGVFDCSDMFPQDIKDPWIPHDFVYNHDCSGNKLNVTTEYALVISNIPLSGNLSYCFGQSSDEVKSHLQQEIYFWEPDYIFTNKEAHQGTKKHFYKCVDHIMEEGKVRERPVVFNCRDQKTPGHTEHDWIMRIVHTVAGGLGVICLTGAFVIYLLLPSLRNIHGQIVTCNIFSTLGVTIFLIIVYHSNNLAGSVECKIIGYGGYFLTMAMFSWMTVLCIDLFWTFVRPRLMSSRGSGKRLVLFHIFGWGLPSFLTGLAGLLDHQAVINNPGIGSDKCFIKEESAIFALHIPITILVSVNVILYLITIFIIRRIRMEAKGKIDQRSDLQAAKTQLILYTKLFVVMGVLWGCESLGYFIYRINGEEIRAIRILFDIFAVLNMLRGVFIFIIFVCKVSVWNGLKKLGRKKNYNTYNTETKTYLSSRKMKRSTTSVAYSTTYA